MVYNNNSIVEYDVIGKFKENYNNYLIRKNKKYYYNIPMSFDIETSSFYNKDNEKQAIIYQWQFAIIDDVFLGRTIEEFLFFISVLSEKLNINDNVKLIIYVHNLSYEFQFIHKYFNWSDVFATDSRKVLYAETNGIIFKCSYFLSASSLSTVAKNLQTTKISKLVGDLDYSLVRHQSTPLSQEEINYCINDVLIITYYIKEQIDIYGDITKIPYTNTGRIRRHTRENCFKSKRYNNFIKKLTLETREFKLLRNAFQGGFTHANPLYINSEVNNVHSFDFTSSYPAVMLMEYYPMSKGKNVVISSIDDFNKTIKKYCCLFTICFFNIKQKKYLDSIISYSKCLDIENEKINNGRVYSADKLVITITELDFYNINNFYNYDYFILGDFYIYEKGYLPKEIINTIIELYKSKTELKGIKGSEVEYMTKKEMLNSLYGMCVYNPIKNQFTYKDGVWYENQVNYDKAIEDYNNERSRFLFYPWGVWVTAYARKNLFSAILELKNDYIYSDTDSVKFINMEKHKKYFDKYNKDVIEKLLKMASALKIDFNLLKPVTKDGKQKIIGLWDYEGMYKRFKTLGAKRYLIEDNDGINITVSGLNKNITLNYLLEKYKTPDNIFNYFTNNLYIPKGYTGKNTHTYIDNVMTGSVTDYLGNTENYSQLSGIHLDESDYSLGMSEIFINFFLQIKQLYN